MRRIVLLAVALASLPAAAAQQSDLGGKVRSAREVTIPAGQTVQGDLAVTSGARIGGDLIFGAGRVQMDGAVAGSVLGSSGSYARAVRWSASRWGSWGSWASSGRWCWWCWSQR